jgi:WXG100 family type VII secretion target
MAVQISINTDAARTIVSNLQGQIEQITDLMGRLDAEVNKLLTDADWKGDAADKFFEVYDSVKATFTQKVPEDLTTLKESINTNLSNLIEADATGAR